MPFLRSHFFQNNRFCAIIGYQSYKGWTLRHIFLIFSAALWLTIGKFVFGIDSIIDLIHFAIVPFGVSYLFIIKPKISKQNIRTYISYFAFLVLLVLAYFIAFTRTIPDIRISWLELPVAIYFLLSIYLVLWFVDKIYNFIIALLFARTIKNKVAFSVIRVTGRMGIIIFLAVPYIVAIFLTHWVKFADIDNPVNLKDMEHGRVSFTSDDGTELKGWFINSQNRISDSTVIIIPGRSAAKNLFSSYARIFSESGYNVLLFDLRGNGSSGGHKFTFSVKETNDVVSAVQYITKEKPQFCNYLFGYGINEGASALIGAASDDEHFAAIVVDNTGGYEIEMPDWLAGYLPKFMENSLVNITRKFVTLNTGAAPWGAEGIYQKMEQVSPCPVLVANSIKNTKPNRLKAIDLFTKARDPKKLWLAPTIDDPNTYNQYFMNVIQTFENGKNLKQAGNWRVSKNMNN